MQFGIFFELQVPRPWTGDVEQRVFQEALDQCELADALGYTSCWAVEHHFLEEYAHSSAPEIFLAAASQRTQRMRLGHGIVLMPPRYNHPARVAERIATLDLVSGGRVEFGTGESSSRAELEGFGVPLEEKRAMWLEATEQCADMLALDPFPGFEGRYFSMPARNVVPKPVQRPHPPLWMACSNREQVMMAARHGLGALTFALVDPASAKEWITQYYETLKRECVPVGHAVNANIVLLSPLSLHADEEEARRRGLEGSLFHTFASAHHYVFGEHRPGRTNLWDQFEHVRDLLEPSMRRGLPSGIGTPEQARALVRGYRDAGADHVLFMAQLGRTRHEHACESLRMFAEQVMPEFTAGEEDRQRAKADALAPYIEAALARKPRREAPEPAPYTAYKRTVVEGETRSGEYAKDSWQVVLARIVERAGIARTKE